MSNDLKTPPPAPENPLPGSAPSGPSTATPPAQDVADAQNNPQAAHDQQTNAESARHRSHSKIGRLPKTTRDKLNFMIRDGVAHQDTVTKLGLEANGITARNVSGWEASPHYQNWLVEQEWLENLREEQESAFDLFDGFDSIKFNQAALQLAVTRLFRALRRLDNPGPNDKPEVTARTLAGLVHALSRASRESTNLEKYREACAAAVAAQLKQLNVDRDLSDAEYDLLIKKMDQVFKVPRRQTQPPPKNGTP
jgi:hypothetical protein